VDGGDLSRERAYQYSELVLVDDELAARARAALPLPPDALARRTPPEVARVSERDAGEGQSSPGRTSDESTDKEANGARRRLTALSEIEPVRPQRRITRVASLAFAATAWGLLVLVLVEMAPWRV
jgi:hypothetical protein